MRIVHLTPHLGGGVGKAHAAVQAAASDDDVHTYCLLEEPRDHRFADMVCAAGGEIVIAADRPRVERLVAEADIVQVEWWNHPRLFELLSRPLPPMRSLFWAHVSGLFPPLIPAGLVERAGCFVFTSPCSLEAAELRDLAPRVRERIGVAGSGFGFEPPVDVRTVTERSAVAYLGTVDFVKMHPESFAILDTAKADRLRVDIWGGYDPEGDAAKAARGMLHPERAVLKGQTADPRAVLENAAIFFYPLRPDHFGTAENALVEAMSVGTVPLVMSNPAERAIVADGVTGLVATDAEDAARKLVWLLDHPMELARMSAAAMAHAARSYRPERTAAILKEWYHRLAREPKVVPDFSAALGAAPRDWFLSTQYRAGAVPEQVRFAPGLAGAKGSLDHFLQCFPEDPGLLSLLSRSLSPPGPPADR